MAESTPIKNTRQDSAVNQEEFLIANRVGIVQKLRQLAKTNRMVTATFNGGSQTMNTAILDVIRDMDLVAIDYGPTEAINQQMLKADRIIFKTDLDGVDVQFTVTSITKAKYQGQPVFAIPIPETILWIQRRQAFRVRVPLGIPAHLEIENSESGDVDKYPVLDISAGGLAFQDDQYRLKLESGSVITKCRLVLPDHGSAEITLEVRNCFPANRNKPDAGQRLGCAFVNLNMNFASDIQRYIHAMEVLRKRTED
jgi:c-di-GMP-binding flagellar brake protein YcgR